MMDISVAKASLLALFLETLLYGVFLTLYFLILFVLLTKTGVQRRLLISVATLLLCIATAHLVVVFVRALEAFIFNVQANANTYYDNRALPLYLVQTALYITQTTLADGVIVWRCYVLNNKSYYVAIPGCIVLIANTVVGCYVIWFLSVTPPGSPLSAPAHAFITTFYTLTMVISVTCTSLIAWRIYHTHTSSVMANGSRSLSPVFIAIIETGALYATNVLALLLAFLIGSNGVFAAVDIITPIVGIFFCLIILQVHFQVGGNWPAERSVGRRGITSVESVELTPRTSRPWQTLAVLVVGQSMKETKTEDG